MCSEFRFVIVPVLLKGLALGVGLDGSISEMSAGYRDAEKMSGPRITRLLGT
jgi:hypothetical protein